MKTIVIDPAADSFVEKLSELPGLELIGVFPNGAKGLEAVSGLRPDIVFLNLDLPEGGLSLLEKLVREGVLVIASSEWGIFEEDALRLGAVGFVGRPVEEGGLGGAWEGLKRI